MKREEKKIVILIQNRCGEGERVRVWVTYWQEGGGGALASTIDKGERESVAIYGWEWDFIVAKCDGGKFARCQDLFFFFFLSLLHCPMGAHCILNVSHAYSSSIKKKKIFFFVCLILSGYGCTSIQPLSVSDMVSGTMAKLSYPCIKDTNKPVLKNISSQSSVRWFISMVRSMSKADN